MTGLVENLVWTTTNAHRLHLYFVSSIYWLSISALLGSTHFTKIDCTGCWYLCRSMCDHSKSIVIAHDHVVVVYATGTGQAKLILQTLRSIFANFTTAKLHGAVAGISRSCDAQVDNKVWTHTHTHACTHTHLYEQISLTPVFLHTQDPDHCRYIVGVVLSGSGAQFEDKLLSNGFKIATFPHLEKVLVVDHPANCLPFIYLGVYRVYPFFKSYTKVWMFLS